MRASIIGAMKEEIIPLLNKIKNCETFFIEGNEIYKGTLNGVSITLLKTGIGKVSSAISTTLLLTHYHPELVINIGSAGSLTSLLNIGDIVISNEVRYHDVDVTSFGYKPGQVVGCPSAFLADGNLVSATEDCTKQLNLYALRGLIVSGDIFIKGGYSLKRIQASFPQAIAVDMEAASIGHVCHQFSIPFVAIRAISDRADRESHLSFSKFLSIAAKQSSLLVEKLLDLLATEENSY